MRLWPPPHQQQGMSRHASECYPSSTINSHGRMVVTLSKLCQGISRNKYASTTAPHRDLLLGNQSI